MHRIQNIITELGIQVLVRLFRIPNPFQILEDESKDDANEVNDSEPEDSFEEESEDELDEHICMLARRLKAACIEDDNESLKAESTSHFSQVGFQASFT